MEPHPEVSVSLSIVPGSMDAVRIARSVPPQAVSLGQQDHAGPVPIRFLHRSLS